MKLKKSIQESPNLTVILPGGCNANCGFCFWKPSYTDVTYLSRLNHYLSILPDIFTQCSISGGEPTYSEFLTPTLETISRYNFPKVVLTSNGGNISNVIDILKNKVRYINISRHSIDDIENYKIFNTKDVPSTKKLTTICKKLNDVGIPVNINCVVEENFGDKQYLYDYVDFAFKVGASSVTFRKNYNSDNLDNFKLHDLFSNVKSIRKDSCPVCKLDSKLIKGMPVNFKYSLNEPSNHVNFIYELIYQPDGILYEDWNFGKPVEFYNPMDVLYSSPTVPNYSSCGNTGSVRGYSSCG